jgi:hypothetical protein
LNKINKIFVVFYFVLFVGVFTVIVSVDSELERPFEPLNLAPQQLSIISYSEIVDVDKKIIFNTFADFENYHRILPNNVLSVNKNQEKQLVYDIILFEKGIKTKLTVEHTIEPYHKQIIKVIDGDAQGTIINQNFESYDNKTKILIDIDLKTRGILTPFVFLPQHNVVHAVNTIVATFVDYSNRSYDENEKIVDDLYREILLRPVDSQGLIKYRILLEEEKITMDEIRNDLLNSEEYNSKLLLTDMKDISDLSQDTKNSIDELYNIVLRRNADVIGLQYFGSALENGKMALHKVRDSLLTSDEFYSLPVETREIKETYMSNKNWQIVNQTYYEIHDNYPSEKIIRAYGIFFDNGDITLDEIKQLLK